MTLNDFIEKKATEFDQHYIAEWRWKREAPNKPSASDALRSALRECGQLSYDQGFKHGFANATPGDESGNDIQRNWLGTNDQTHD